MTGKGHGLSDNLHQEFYIDSDGIRLHAKLDLPAEEKAAYPLVIDLEKHFSQVTFKIIHDDTHCYDRHLDEVIREILLFLNGVSGKADGHPECAGR